MESKWRKYFYLFVFASSWILTDLILGASVKLMITASMIFISMMVAYILVDSINFFATSRQKN